MYVVDNITNSTNTNKIGFICGRDLRFTDLKKVYYFQIWKSNSKINNGNLEINYIRLSLTWNSLQNQIFVITVILSILLLIPTGVYAENIFRETEAFGQYPDIGQIMAEKITFEFGDDMFDIYYGYKGSLDSMGSKYEEPILFSMTINEERKSIEIIMEDVPEKTDFWVRIPPEVLYAEGEKFTVLVDGVNTGYDLIIFPNDYAIGFIISETTENIEIVGTRVIPEFGSFSIMILGISIVGLVYFIQQTSFGRVRIRNNPSK